MWMLSACIHEKENKKLLVINNGNCTKHKKPEGNKEGRTEGQKEGRSQKEAEHHNKLLGGRGLKQQT